MDRLLPSDSLADARLLLESIDQPTRARVVVVRLARVVELRLDLLGQRLAQLDTCLLYTSPSPRD